VQTQIQSCKPENNSKDSMMAFIIFIVLVADLSKMTAENQTFKLVQAYV
jgi:hypothetical protein